MTMTLTPFPSVGGSPPRVRVGFNAGAGGRFTDLVVTRDGRRLRAQPPVGVQSTFVDDYEAPYGRTTVYAATGTYIPGAATAAFAESWANLSGWSGSGWSAVSGTARSSTDLVSLTRSVGGPIARVVVGSSEWASVDLLTATDDLVARFTWATGFAGVHLQSPASTVGQGLTGGAVEMTVNAAGTVVTATGTGWALSVPVTGTATKVRLVSRVFGSGQTAIVDDIACYVAGSAATYAVTGSTVLDEVGAWLIHPSQPSLSTCVEGGPDVNVAAATDQSRDHEAQQVVYQPAGRDLAVVYPVGPRLRGKGQIVLNTHTLGARDRIMNLVRDGAPLLLRAPHTLAWDLPELWYSVGDVQQTRPIDIADDTWRQIVLPVLPTSEPPLRLAPAATWGSSLAAGETWADGGDTWFDELTGSA